MNFYFSLVYLSWYAAYDSYQSSLEINGRYDRVINVPHFKFNDFLTSAFRKDTYTFEDAPSYKIFIPISLVVAIPAIRIIRQGVNKNLKLENILLTAALIFFQSLLFSIG